MVWSGEFGLGAVRQAGQGLFGHGSAWSGRSGRGRLGVVGCGAAWLGRAGLAWFGRLRRGAVGQGRPRWGEAWRGLAGEVGQVAVRRVEAGLGEAGKASRGQVGPGAARQAGKPKGWAMTKPLTPEDRIHAAIVQLLLFTAAPGVVWFHCPNGEARDVVTGAKLKRMGVRPGVADLVLILPGGKAAFLEVKSANGRQSEAQREFEASVTETGALYAVARSIDEAQAVLKTWGALK